MPKPIIIGCSPRTGSTLLFMSLNQHSLAVSGSEWFNERLNEIDPKAYERKQTGLPCNLIKLFGHQSYHPTFFDIMNSGILVHLYREDKQAQIASFERAWETGQWTADQQSGQWKYERPADLSLLNADAIFREPADISISYEFMIANWNLVIWSILNLAGWPLRELPMATKKIPPP